MNFSLKSIVIAVLYSLGASLITLIGGLVWLFVAGSRPREEGTAVGLDLRIFIKHVCIPVALIVFIVALIIFLKRK
jgi:hypothetical protein